MPLKIHWLDEPEIDEVSGVDLAANRRRFKFFKSANGGEDRMKDKKDTKKQPVHRGRKQTEDEPATEPSADEQTSMMEPIIEEGVALYPWQQCIADMSAAYSTDDAPRVCALMLAQHGEGPGGEIKLPADTDPLTAAQQAVEGASSLMSDNPLLRQEPKSKATTATKSAVRAAVTEALQALGIDKLMAAMKKSAKAKPAAKATDEAPAKKKAKAPVKTKPTKKTAARAKRKKNLAAGMVVDVDEEAVSTLITDLKELNERAEALLSGNDPVHVDDDDNDEEDDDEPRGGVTATGDTEDEESPDDGDDDDEDEDSVDTDDDDEQEDGEEEPEPKSATKQLKAVVAEIRSLNARLEALEAGGGRAAGGKRRRPRSKSVAPALGQDHGDPSDPQEGVYRSTILGTTFPIDRIKPYLPEKKNGTKRTRVKRRVF